MPSIRDTSAWITVDDVKLPEYKLEMDGDNIVKCHVPSESGKRFKILFCDKSPFRNNEVVPTATLELDGVYMKRAWGGTSMEEFTIDGLQGLEYFTPFLFADLQMTDEDEHRSKRSGAGLIKVMVNWRGPGKPSTGPNVPQSIGNGPVHERIKKLSSHCVALGERSAVSQTMWVVREVLTQYTPIEFHFHYANKDLLMARDIMPIPVPDNADVKRFRDVDDADDLLTAEEEAEFKRLQEKVQRRDIKRVKKEHEVKEEKNVDLTIPEAPKRTIVIDLTDD